MRLALLRSRRCIWEFGYWRKLQRGEFHELYASHDEGAGGVRFGDIGGDHGGSITGLLDMGQIAGFIAHGQQTGPRFGDHRQVLFFV